MGTTRSGAGYENEKAPRGATAGHRNGACETWRFLGSIFHDVGNQSSGSLAHAGRDRGRGGVAMTYIPRQDDGPAAMERAADALEYIDAHDRENWLRMGMALKSEFNDAGFSIWDDWSRSAENYSQNDAMIVWRGIKSGGGVGIGSLFHLARENGWRDDVTYTAATMTPEQIEQRRQARMQATAQAEAEIQQEQAQAAKWAATIWQQAQPVQSNPYLERKQVSPTSTLRQIDVAIVNEFIGYRLKSKGEELEGDVLVVPMRKAGSTGLCSLEFIDGTGRKTALAGRGTKSGAYWATERLDSPAILLAGEGVATVLSASQDAQLPGVAALSCGNLKSVAVAMREQYPNAKIIMLADLDKQTGEPDQHAIDAAAAVDGYVAVPDFGQDRESGQTDFNDLHVAMGPDAVREFITKSLQPLKKGGAGGADGASPSGPGVKPCPTTENGSGASGAAGPKSGAAMPKGYFVNAAGLHYLDDSNPDKEPVPYRLGPVIEVLGWTRNTDSREWGQLLRWRDPDGVVHEWAMPASLLFDRAGGWVAELVRGGWIPEPGQKQRAWLAAFFSKSNPPERVRCVSSVGWHHGRFVLPDHVYGLPGAEPIVMQSAMSANPYQQAGGLAGWQDTIGKWSVGNSRLTLAVCLALSGPLLAKAGMGPGGVNMFGTSSTGKSTCLLAGLSVWGGPDAKASWNATKNGLEGALEIHNDTFYALDEMSEAPGRSMSEVVYMLGNGAGRARAHQDGSARRVRKWRCAVFSTGEIRVEDKLKAEGQQCRAGHGVRLLELPADAGAGLGCWEDLHGHATGAEFSQVITDAVSEHHGHAGRAFVQNLIDREQDLTIATDLDAITKAWTPEGASGQVVRCVRRFALMAVAGELATALEVTPWTPGHAMQMVKRCLDDWLQARGTTGDMEHGQAVKLVLGYLARYGQARFENLDTPEPNRIIDRSGFKRTSTGGRVQFVFLPDQLAAVVPGLNITQAVKSLDKAGLLRRNDKHLSQKITLPELGRCRCYVIEPPDLEGGDVC